MEKYGFEHLRFSRNTYRYRNSLLITGCLSILFFEYHITKELKIYNIGIPSSLIEFSLYLVSFWTTFQFIFTAIDDFIDWKKNFLIDDRVRPKSKIGDRSIIIEIFSFSKGKIKHVPFFGISYANLNKEPEFVEVYESLKHDMEQLEARLKEEVKAIESFREWYKRYSWFTIFRFSVIEFGLPILFILYSVVVCQLWPLLPK